MSDYVQLVLIDCSLSDIMFEGRVSQLYSSIWLMEHNVVLGKCRVVVQIYKSATTKKEVIFLPLN